MSFLSPSYLSFLSKSPLHSAVGISSFVSRFPCHSSSPSLRLLLPASPILPSISSTFFCEDSSHDFKAHRVGRPFQVKKPLHGGFATLHSSSFDWKRICFLPSISPSSSLCIPSFFSRRHVHSPLSRMEPPPHSPLGGVRTAPPSSTWDPSSSMSTTRCKHWMSLLIYGTSHAPLLGTCWPPLLSSTPTDLAELQEDPKMLPPSLSPYASASFCTRALYCKALVSASGGHRMARDYVAGLTAAVDGDAELVALSLQHPASEKDVEVFRQHLLDIWCDEQVKEEKESEREEKGSVASSSSLWGGITDEASSMNVFFRDHHEKCTSTDKDGGESEEKNLTEEEMEMAELFILAISPIVRCFLYDVMCAATYQRSRNRLLMEETEKKLIHLGVHVLGVPRERVMALWKVVLAEAQLKKGTYKLLVPSIE